MKTNRGVTNLVCKQGNFYQEFFLIPTPALSMQFNSFLFLSRPASWSWNWYWRLFFQPDQWAECKGRLFVLDEASKESKLIAGYRIIWKSDWRLSSGESSIIFYRFDASAKSVTYSLHSSTADCSVKLYYALLFEKAEQCVLAVPNILAPADLNCFWEELSKRKGNLRATGGEILWTLQTVRHLSRSCINYLTFATDCHFQDCSMGQVYHAWHKTGRVREWLSLVLLVFFSLLQAISKLNTISKAFQTLKTLIDFDCPVSSQQKMVLPILACCVTLQISKGLNCNFLDFWSAFMQNCW